MKAEFVVPTTDRDVTITMKESEARVLRAIVDTDVSVPNVVREFQRNITNMDVYYVIIRIQQALKDIGIKWEK